MFRMILILALRIVVRDRRVVRAQARTRSGRVCMAGQWFLHRSDFVKQLKTYL